MKILETDSWNHVAIQEPSYSFKLTESWRKMNLKLEKNMWDLWLGTCGTSGTNGIQPSMNWLINQIDLLDQPI